MQVALETGAWVVTGGVATGVSGLMAETRRDVDDQVPLIGFTPWGVVEGRQALWEAEGDWRVMSHTEKLAVVCLRWLPPSLPRSLPLPLASLSLSFPVPSPTHLPL